jgi:hypothetical protein
MIKNYHKIFDTLDTFKLEAQKTIEIIRKNLLRSRPTMPNRYQLEDYIKRIEFANEIILNLDILVNKTFNTYIEFINIYWDVHDNLDSNEQQKILADKYDMSLNEWQGISSKIERFNEIIKNFI